MRIRIDAGGVRQLYAFLGFVATDGVALLARGDGEPSGCGR
jgi:hypothetical protein